jgi:hypothetical protein
MFIAKVCIMCIVAVAVEVGILTTANGRAKSRFQ